MLIKSPIKAGITGGIGSGKSIVCDIFRMLGVPVYLADERAKYLMNSDEWVKQQIIDSFGEKAYLHTGELNRRMIAGTVFPDSKKLEELNAIVHPAVERDFNSWVEQNSNAVYVIKEAALLVETGSYKRLDLLITVTALEAIRIDRVLQRDSHRKPDEIRAIISRQLVEAEKVKKSRFVIINDDKTLIIPQVLKIHAEINNLAQIR